ncbi:hypothetical protein COHA_005211 [Chlorella ohadii]|uniref:Plant heme peroxidase family profile domain-containing protein n=1 Tax=Chlorella ohadii TaxID=2649997 RepID=A0AAD5H6D2_9CHLO|nr:hypothetical protein COHA_005211 [Chlorella ohadii]
MAAPQRQGLALLVLLAVGARAGCPFGFSGGLEDAEGGVQGAGRRLQQAGCNINTLAQQAVTNPFVPANPAQGQVDNYIKEVAWKVFQTGYPGFVPGLYKNGVLNTKVPLGGLLRLSFHDAGPFNKAAGKGGANGSLRFELGVRPNTNKNIIDAAGLCDRWRTMINNALAADPKVPKGVQISYADVYQLIGAAVVVAAGGPTKAQIYDPLPIGRRDATVADNVAQMPGGGISWDNLACLFLTNGYSLEELVALSGAHELGFRQDRTTPMTANPNSFTNEYFTAVINGNRNLFNSDRVLWGNHARSDAAVQSFANNKGVFFSAFAKASCSGCGAS